MLNSKITRSKFCFLNHAALTTKKRFFFIVRLMYISSKSVVIKLIKICATQMCSIGYV